MLNLQDAVRNLQNAKRAEELCRQKRITLEEQIAALVPGPEAGQKTVTLEDGTKITVKRGLNYKADIDGIRKAAEQLELEHVPIQSKTTHTLDEKGYEYYRSNYPSVYQELSQYVTVTPAKVAVTIK